MRFSLRTLLLLMLLIGSGAALHYRWEPWALVREIDGRYASFSPDGQQMLVLENGKTNAARISVRDALGRSERFSIELSESPTQESSARWVSGGRWIEVKTERTPSRPGYGLSRTELFDGVTGTTLFLSGAPKRVRFADGEKFFLATFLDGRCEVWDAIKGERIAPVQLATFKNFYSEGRTDEEIGSGLVLAPCGNRVAASWNGKTLICDARNGDEVQECDGTMLGDGDYLFSPNGQLQTYRGVDRIRIRMDAGEWVLGDGQFLLNKAAYSPEHTTLAVLDHFSYCLKIFELNTQKELMNVQQVEISVVLAGVWCRNGLILTNTRSGDLYIGFDGTKTKLGQIEAVSHDRKRCLVNDDSAWRMRETKTGEILDQLGLVKVDYGSAEFSPDDKHIAIFDCRDKVQIFEQRRDEARAGVFALPELWITLVLAVSSIWSLRRDWKEMRKTT